MDAGSLAGLLPMYFCRGGEDRCNAQQSASRAVPGESLSRRGVAKAPLPCTPPEGGLSTEESLRLMAAEHGFCEFGDIDPEIEVMFRSTLEEMERETNAATEKDGAARR
jgi:hypothetical protein